MCSTQQWEAMIMQFLSSFPHMKIQQKELSLTINPQLQRSAINCFVNKGFFFQQHSTQLIIMYLCWFIKEIKGAVSGSCTMQLHADISDQMLLTFENQSQPSVVKMLRFRNVMFRFEQMRSLFWLFLKQGHNTDFGKNSKHTNSCSLGAISGVEGTKPFRLTLS